MSGDLEGHGRREHLEKHVNPSTWKFSIEEVTDIMELRWSRILLLLKVLAICL